MRLLSVPGGAIMRQVSRRATVVSMRRKGMASVTTASSTEARTEPSLTPASLAGLKEQFDRDGFCVIDKFWSKQTCADLRAEMDKLIRGFDLEEVRTIFSTNDQKRTSDEYFMNSGGAVRFFWEEDAFDEKGEFRQDRLQSINKVGHALHDLNPVFQRVTYTQQVGEIARKVGGLDTPLACQSMYIFKQPRIGGKVGAHQDGTFLYTEPQSVVGLWWALEDCRLDNGCLWAVPGSHRSGVKCRFKRKAEGEGTEFVPPEPKEWDLTGAVPLEVGEGALVLLHNALIHYSAENRSDKSRHAYSVHVIEGGRGCVYPSDNWLRRPASIPFNVLP